MITQTKTKNQYYLDLKLHDRLKFIKGNNLELVLDVDNINDEGVTIYTKDSYGTQRYFLKSHCTKYLGSGLRVHSHGKRHGNRVHVHLEMEKGYEFQRQ